MEIGDGVRSRACSLYDGTIYPATSARMEATSEARKGLLLPQGNQIGSQDPWVQQCTDISQSILQLGLDLSARWGIEYVIADGPLHCEVVVYPLLQSNTNEPQGSVPQQCETDRGLVATEVPAKLAAPKDERVEAGSGHYNRDRRSGSLTLYLIPRTMIAYSNYVVV